MKPEKAALIATAKLLAKDPEFLRKAEAGREDFRQGRVVRWTGKEMEE